MSLLNSQYLSNKDLKEYQLLRLKKIIRHSFGNVPYYKNLFQKIGFHPRNIKSLDDVQKNNTSRKSYFEKKYWF